MREFSHFFLFYPNGSYSILVCIFLLESKAEESACKRHLLELIENASSFLGLTARLIAYILTLTFDRLARRRFQTPSGSIGGNCDDLVKSETTVFCHSGESEPTSFVGRNPVNSICSGCPRIRVRGRLLKSGMTIWGLFTNASSFGSDISEPS
jgi:hypothetical protein